MTWIASLLVLAGPFAADAELRQLSIDGTTREALVFPPTVTGDDPPPLVFVFHGHGGSMHAMARRFRMHRLWPEAVVVVPQGLNTPGRYDPEGRRPGWQKRPGDQQDRDLKFFDALRHAVDSAYRIDADRVYATGHSNGGGFTYLLSQARPGVFAAIAPSAAGAGGLRGIREPQPIPVLHLAGRRDTVVPFAGQMRTVDRLKRINQCTDTGADWAPGCVRYASAVGAPVITFLHDGGHQFPQDGPPHIVRFFREHRRAADPPPADPDPSDADPERSAPVQADVVVWSATPAGIAAAIEAARDGASVVLLEPTRHVGGLTASGLSHPDFRTFEALTGCYLDFTERVHADYVSRYGHDSPEVRDCLDGTHAEPHVNERVFLAMLAEQPTIAVVFDAALQDVRIAEPGDSPDGESAPGRKRVTAIQVTADGVPQSIAADYFIDASYDGDLMAAAGVAFVVGREGRDVYGESLAPPESDDQLQGYNFRFTATRDPDLRVPVEQPRLYRREMFTDLLPLLRDGTIERVFGYPSKCVFKAHIPVLPRGKYDINDVSRAPVRLSLPGRNRDWPEGSAATRQQIFDEHLAWNAGLLWFLQHDPEVPDAFQQEAREWGWCRDEFTDNGHLPWQLYVRESRRMVGVHVFTQRDTESHEGTDVRARRQPDAIAFSDYGPNCHGTDHEGPLIGGRHTGEFYQRTAPYQIPRGVMLTKSHSNLLVPVACSASHVGFCALRLEPTWTALGQAAGTAVRLALPKRRTVSSVTAADIREALHAHGAATIYVPDVPRSAALFPAVQWLASAGGLHGLAEHEGDYGRRGAHRIGQYYSAFPDHNFEPDRPLDPELWNRWLRILPEEARAAAAAKAEDDRPLTRGDAVTLLYQQRCPQPDDAIESARQKETPAANDR